MDLEFRNLSYSIHNRITKVKTKEVIKGVSGRFQSGRLVAIMGPSGAGKSSLLNAISGYRSAGVTGELLVNGEIRNNHEFQKYSCYITQEDLHQPLLTVREIMTVSAKLKQPKLGAGYTDQILHQLGLLEHVNTPTDVLSGGQKKRLSIALELVNNPPIFFLDEPTSGLDTVAAMLCVKLLRQLARQGRTVICTIHQPTASLLELFDQVYILADGWCIFQGDTSAIVPHLQSVGLPCPKHHNPADFIIEVTEHPENITVLCEEMLNGKLYKTAKLEDTPNEPAHSMVLKISYQTEDNVLEKEITLSNEKCTYKPEYNEASDSSSISSQITQTGNSSLEWMKMSKNADSCGYNSTYFQQFSILLRRMLLQIFRNKQGLYIQLAHHVGCALLIGVCFFNMANDGAQMFNQLKLSIGMSVFFAYTQIMVPVLVYPTEVKLVKKEHFNRWYSLTPYYAALTVSKIPVQITLNILFCTVVYFMVGVPFSTIRFVTLCVIGNFISLTSEGLGLAIGSIFSITNGCAMGPAFIAPLMGLAIYGFDFAHEIPDLMNIFMKLSFIRCGVVAIVLAIFGFGRETLDCEDVYCYFAKPKVLLQYLDIDKSSIWLELLTIFGLMIVFRTACYISLRWRFST